MMIYMGVRYAFCLTEIEKKLIFLLLNAVVFL
jgi:hypothetical protein